MRALSLKAVIGDVPTKAYFTSEGGRKASEWSSEVVERISKGKLSKDVAVGAYGAACERNKKLTKMGRESNVVENANDEYQRIAYGDIHSSVLRVDEVNFEAVENDKYLDDVKAELNAITVKILQSSRLDFKVCLKAALKGDASAIASLKQITAGVEEVKTFLEDLLIAGDGRLLSYLEEC